ncbi:MAG: hypothetical protein A2722_03535 [Candidatus Doudnabacteria bacterium RIFCSPHIGHO2_01_FULL_50_11]|uniref:Uncharacterized protein n=1 Tax=Candidatus Doudnabacteria bacterium RIFCSPHIGHO2_01_FULL_50_11 TaxID=1817828 RepID=A0A1F5PIV4_9BACT|nr:MAG: hypothetical protein A2722_03535 [Candidatus Doudnabacteria bacterium RIFCSPHIGHO2_01_FULL_50_11]
MPDFQHYSTRYRFAASGLEGRPGEIPHIAIRDQDSLPSLEYSNFIGINFLSQDLPTSTLGIAWTTDSGVILRWWGKADDARLKEEFKRNPQLAQGIIALLMKGREDRQSIFHKRETPPITKTIALAHAHVPQELQGPAQRVEGWQEFIKAHQRILLYHPTTVTGDEHLVLGITSGCLLFNRSVEFEVAYGAFDPQGQAPTITESEIYWELWDKNIVVVVPHQSADEKLAKHYGYLEPWRSYLDGKKVEREHWDEVWRRNFQEERQKAVAAQENLTNSLLT